MDSITQYFQLAARRPELFAPSDQIPLCMDEETLRNYSASTGKPVGVVYDNSPYYLSWLICAYGKMGSYIPTPGWSTPTRVMVWS